MTTFEVDLTLRSVALTEELVHYVRSRCERLAPLVGEDGSCRVVLERRDRDGAPPTVTARVEMRRAQARSLVCESDPDPFLAARNALAVLEARLSSPEPKRGRRSATLAA
jgi:hypothetical protein